MINEHDAVALESVEIQRGKAMVIPDLSMRVPRGTVYGLVGPSGSGKTTVIRAVLGLTPVASGSLTVLGRNAGDAANRQLMGYMPQGSGVYPDLSGRENLAFFASIYRAPTSRIDELLHILRMTEVADRPLRTYSGGQIQRIGLAIALLQEPPLLVLDEPTVGLDLRLRRDLWAEFRALAKQGTTLLVSTHVMDEAQHCDRIACLADGRLSAEGSPAELLALTGASDLESAILAIGDEQEYHHVR